MNREDFAQAVDAAFSHLYDVAYLRNHILARLVAGGGRRDEDAGWRVHRLLLDAIERLNPGQSAPAGSKPWRRYRLLYHHYVEGEDSRIVARELCVTRRHFYRLRTQAVRAVSAVLWEHFQDQLVAMDAPDADLPEAHDRDDSLRLLRAEAERLAQSTEDVEIPALVAEVCQLCRDLASKQAVQIRTDLAEELPLVHVRRTILLHLLLGLIQQEMKRPGLVAISIKARAERARVSLTLEVQAAASKAVETSSPQFAALRELAATEGIVLHRQLPAGRTLLQVDIPAVTTTTVLVVDDNPDFFHFFRRCLAGRGYNLIRPESPASALRLAKERRPDVITLDLMMPEVEGLSFLQRLRAQPETKDTPVIVCTVLAERELALSLGADCFLSKPVTEQELLAALEAVLGA